MPDKKQVVITVDGACLGNGQSANPRAAAAAILNYMGRRRAVGIYIGEGTNQRAEILAAVHGLESLKEPCVITLRSDSKYVVETMNGNFQRRTNLDCWERLDAAAAPHEVLWEWVKGHNGDADQEAADRLARSIAQLGYVPDMMLSEAVNRIQNVVTPALREAVAEGLRYLANDCDGARHRDGVGFNRFDTEYGHNLAAKRELSPRELAAGRRLLRRYEGQLNYYNPALAAIL
jgi:ribonuclease HI